jgi:hypothetical protein
MRKELRDKLSRVSASTTVHLHKPQVCQITIHECQGNKAREASAPVYNHWFSMWSNLEPQAPEWKGCRNTQCTLWPDQMWLLKSDEMTFCIYGGSLRGMHKYKVERWLGHSFCPFHGFIEKTLSSLPYGQQRDHHPGFAPVGSTGPSGYQTIQAWSREIERPAFTLLHSSSYLNYQWVFIIIHAHTLRLSQYTPCV